MSALVTTKGFLVRRDLLRDTGATNFGLRVRAGDEVRAVSVERGRGGGTAGGGKLTYLVWQFLGVIAMG